MRMAPWSRRWWEPQRRPSPGSTFSECHLRQVTSPNPLTAALPPGVAGRGAALRQAQGERGNVSFVACLGRSW